MSAQDLLLRLTSMGATVRVQDGRLRVNFARGQVTDDLKAAIASHKAELLELLSRRESGAGASIQKIPRDGPLPLSYFQERLWVLSRFEPENTAFNMWSLWGSEQPASPTQIVKALGRIIERHEILRTVFVDNDGVPSIRLMPPESVPVDVRDLRDQPRHAQLNLLMEESNSEAHVPFDLRIQPPARFTVYRVYGDRLVTRALIHHIAADAWSFALLGREIEAAYAGGEPPKPTTDLQYADFAAWQREAFSGAAARSELEWWKNYLAGAPTLSTLPPDHSEPTKATGTTCDFRFSRELSDSLRALVRAERATVYMALVAACAIALRSQTGQDDVLFGSPMGSRELSEFETIIGPFVNVLVLRVGLGGDPTFADLLGRCRAAVLDSHAHRNVPFEKIVEALNPSRSLNHSPIFQMAVVHQAATDGLRIDSAGALFDVTWFVREVDGMFVGGLEYRSDLYERATIEWLSGSLERILKAASENPARCLSELTSLARMPNRPLSAGGVSQAKVRGNTSVPARSDDVSRWFLHVDGAPRLMLSLDRPAGAPAHRFGHEAFEISKPLREGMQRIATSHALGLRHVQLGILAVLLHRYTGQTDLTLGLLQEQDRSGHNSHGASAVQALPLRISVNPDAGFDELLVTVSQAIQDARPFSVPLATLAQAARTDVGGDALGACTVFFDAATYSSTEDIAHSFDFILRLPQNSSASGGVFVYNAHSYDAAGFQRFAGHFVSIADGVTRDAALPLSRIALMGREERDAVVSKMRGTRVTHPTDAPLVRLFEDQAQRTPDSPAVLSDALSLTYRELDQAANALARDLQARGVGAGQRVAVGLERTPAVVVALLAILKLGAAYVPLDPRYPADRLGYVLEDAEPTIVLTEAPLLQQLQLPAASAPLVVEPTTLVGAREQTFQVGATSSDSIAYVLYTSGSTGRPKGVEIPNRALSNFLWEMRSAPGIGPDDRILSVTTVSFDIAVLELFLPLISGASVFIAPSNAVADGHALAELTVRSGATVMQATPSTWRMLIEAGWPGLAHLKILCGGEAMTRELAEHLLTRGQSVWNLYGPTETTVWSTVCRVTSGTGPVSIGVPIANTPVYVLDTNGEPVPYGVPGELTIGGAGVARGYLKRPELTAERFLADPFVGGDARMYRTGDGGRLRADGTYECLGRLDQQVKIRGYRIELGEIEAVLRESPDISGAVVAAYEVGPGDTRLVGYYVTRDDATRVSDLRAWCGRKLPTDMVPTLWVKLDAIPLTPNGKTDRKALPAPGVSSSDGAEGPVPPRDALEADLVRIWQEVLGVSVGSVRESFFDLGGHSLLATRLFARIEKATGVTLPLSTLLEVPTVEHLATCIRERREGPSFANSLAKPFSFLVEIKRHGTRPPLFCVAGAGGNVLNLHDLAQHLPEDRPFYGIQAAGVDGRTRPRESIEEMAEEYLLELRVRQPSGPYYLSGYCGGGIVAYEMAQRLLAANERVAFLGLIDLHRPGLTISHNRLRAWGGLLVRFDVSGILQRAREKAQRDSEFTSRVLRVRYHLARGNVIPYDLRDHYLTDSFLKAVERYKLRPYPGMITVFRASEGNQFFTNVGPGLGWETLAMGGLEHHEVLGSHHSLTREPHVQVLASKLSGALQRADAASIESGAPSHWRPAERMPRRAGFERAIDTSALGSRGDG